MTAGQFIDFDQNASILISESTGTRRFRDNQSQQGQCYDLVPYVPRPRHAPLPTHRKLRHLLPPSDHDRDHPSHLLPEDTVPHILSYCDARTLSRASCVSRSWRSMANADELWNELCKETFGVAASELRPPPDPTRLLYVWSYERLREEFCRAARGNCRVGGGGGGWRMIRGGGSGGAGGGRLPVLSVETFQRFAPRGQRV
mmetsp:Transcript_8140/g.17321  ORF Transcript_8140/g.17321 Transcript_8140/m.17321 type:complete len:201 (-) Transcript_8140:320-922(-)